MDDNRKKALAAALGQIEKQFGKGSVMRMGEKGPMAVEAVSTGAPSLDLALGDLSTADGMPIVWIARLLGIPVKSRVAGSGMFDALSLRSSASTPMSRFSGCMV